MSAARDGKRLTADDWRRCAAAGMTMAEAARHLGRGSSTGRKMAALHGISFPPGKRGPKPGTVRFGARRMLTGAALDLYDLCIRKGLCSREALCAIGRADLAATRDDRRRAA